MQPMKSVFIVLSMLTIFLSLTKLSHIYGTIKMERTMTIENNVISMSLYGSNKYYVFGAIRNAQLAPTHFPGWGLRLYVEAPSNHSKYGRVPADALARLEALGADLRYVDPAHTNLPPMMWRFLVAADLSVDRFIVRDADSRLSARDAAAVNMWVQSGQPFHCVRDHPSHSKFAVSGGLWGAKPSALLQLVPTFSDMMKGFGNAYLQDMKFLNQLVWPLVMKYAYCSDSVSCNQYESSHPFPVPRIGYEHLGQVYDENDVGRQGDMNILKMEGENIHCLPSVNNITELIK